MFDKLISWIYIRKLWGPRCSEYEPECPVCERWKEHDEIFNDVGRPMTGFLATLTEDQKSKLLNTPPEGQSE